MMHIIKKDKFSRARGGSSVRYSLSCSACGEFLLIYRKDGIGNILRLYLDRISESKILTDFGQEKSKSKSKLPTLKCDRCGSVIGIPMVYAPEKRLAFRLVRGTFKKEHLT